MDYNKTGIYDDNNKEVRAGDTLKCKYGGNLIVEPFGSQVPGAFTYHPEGAVNKTSHYLLGELESRRPFTIIKSSSEEPEITNHNGISLKELFHHFTDKNIRCDICTPLFREINTISELEKGFGEKLLETEVSNGSSQVIC